jgi:hypothetical protein
VLGRELDGGTPLRRVRHGQFAQPGGVRETLEVRADLLSVPVDDSDRLEDAVAALRAELTDGERRRGGSTGVNVPAKSVRFSAAAMGSIMSAKRQAMVRA